MLGALIKKDASEYLIYIADLLHYELSDSSEKVKPLQHYQPTNFKWLLKNSVLSDIKLIKPDYGLWNLLVSRLC